jgi:hypothetical protein
LLTNPPLLPCRPLPLPSALKIMSSVSPWHPPPVAVGHLALDQVHHPPQPVATYMPWDAPLCARSSWQSVAFSPPCHTCFPSCPCCSAPTSFLMTMIQTRQSHIALPLARHVLPTLCPRPRLLHAVSALQSPHAAEHPVRFLLPMKFFNPFLSTTASFLGTKRGDRFRTV